MKDPTKGSTESVRSHAVFPGLFPLIHTMIRTFQNRGRRIIIPYQGDSDGYGDMQSGIFMGNLCVQDHLPEFFSDDGGIIIIDNGIDPYEFFSSPPADQIITVHIFLYAGSDIYQHSVACIMAVFIIEMTEIINIRKKYRK